MKILKFTVLSFVILLLSSCTKNYTCACTDGTDNVVFTKEIEASNQSEADIECSSIGFECYSID